MSVALRAGFPVSATLVSGGGATSLSTAGFSANGGDRLCVGISTKDGGTGVAPSAVTGSSLVWREVVRQMMTTHSGYSGWWVADVPGGGVAGETVTVTFPAGTACVVHVLAHDGSGGFGATGAAVVETALGPPSVSLSAFSAGSLVYAVGTIGLITSVTASAGATLNAQFDDTASAALWLEHLTAATSGAGTATLGVTQTGYFTMAALEVVVPPPASGPGPWPSVFRGRWDVVDSL